jgi:isopentenyl phosphate kinase
MIVVPDLIFLKLGGSLITDKTRSETPRRDVIARLADEVRQALDARPAISLLLGHGSGSFGHWAASQYGTRDGVHGRQAWVGYSRVAASAARLNRLVSDALLDVGVPVLAVRPSSSARCRDGLLVRLDVHPIRRALEEQLVPLVHGDVALDEVRGGTIVSTEEILTFLAPELRPARILLLGETPGVLMGSEHPELLMGSAVPTITPGNIDSVAASLGGARGRDVTGGMVSKVRQMLELVQRQPGLSVHILSGLQPGLLTQAVLEPDLDVGTRIMSA